MGEHASASASSGVEKRKGSMGPPASQAENIALLPADAASCASTESEGVEVSIALPAALQETAPRGARCGSAFVGIGYKREPSFKNPST